MATTEYIINGELDTNPWNSATNMGYRSSPPENPLPPPPPMNTSYQQPLRANFGTTTPGPGPGSGPGSNIGSTGNMGSIGSIGSIGPVTNSFPVPGSTGPSSLSLTSSPYYSSLNQPPLQQQQQTQQPPQPMQIDHNKAIQTIQYLYNRLKDMEEEHSIIMKQLQDTQNKKNKCNSQTFMILLIIISILILIVFYLFISRHNKPRYMYAPPPLTQPSYAFNPNTKFVLVPTT